MTYLRKPSQSNVELRQTPDLFLKVHWRQCLSYALSCNQREPHIQGVFFCLASFQFSLPSTCNTVHNSLLGYIFKGNGAWNTKYLMLSPEHPKWRKGTCYLPTNQKPEIIWRRDAGHSWKKNRHAKVASDAASVWVKNCTIKILFYTYPFPWAAAKADMYRTWIYKSHVT